MIKNKTTITSFQLTQVEIILAVRDFIKKELHYSDDLDRDGVEIESTRTRDDDDLTNLKITFKRTTNA